MVKMMSRRIKVKLVIKGAGSFSSFVQIIVTELLQNVCLPPAQKTTMKLDNLSFENRSEIKLKSKTWTGKPF